MEKKTFVIALIFLAVFIFLFARDNSDPRHPRNIFFYYNSGTPQGDCVVICVNSPKGSGWENGPCLAEAGQKGLVADWSYYKNWVCDVAHNPRQPVDDLKENQCASFGPGKHFVEVDTDCKFIRAA